MKRAMGITSAVFAILSVVLFILWNTLSNSEVSTLTQRGIACYGFFGCVIITVITFVIFMVLKRKK